MMSNDLLLPIRIDRYRLHGPQNIQESSTTALSVVLQCLLAYLYGTGGSSMMIDGVL